MLFNLSANTVYYPPPTPSWPQKVYSPNSAEGDYVYIWKKEDKKSKLMRKMRGKLPAKSNCFIICKFRWRPGATSPKPPTAVPFLRIYRNDTAWSLSIPHPNFLFTPPKFISRKAPWAPKITLYISISAFRCGISRPDYTPAIKKVM